MIKFAHLISFLMATALIIGLDACGSVTSSTPPASLTPVVGPPGGVPAISSTVTVVTAGQLAIAGQTVYTKSCSGCHGANGQGGRAAVLVGPGANLGRYTTAAGLNQYIVTTMPKNSPGSLSSQDYLNVTSYLLVQNNFVKTETPISAEQLGAIKLQ